jgi:hypothetical protein
MSFGSPFSPFSITAIIHRIATTAPMTALIFVGAFWDRAIKTNIALEKFTLTAPDNLWGFPAILQFSEPCDKLFAFFLPLWYFGFPA